MRIIFTLGRMISLVSAVFGILGTLLLFKGSFAFESPSVYMSSQMVDEMNARNIRRLLLQRLGLMGLVVSFLLAAIAQFFD